MIEKYTQLPLLASVAMETHLRVHTCTPRHKDMPCETTEIGYPVLQTVFSQEKNHPCPALTEARQIATTQESGNCGLCVWLCSFAKHWAETKHWAFCWPCVFILLGRTSRSPDQWPGTRIWVFPSLLSGLQQTRGVFPLPLYFAF